MVYRPDEELLPVSQCEHEDAVSDTECSECDSVQNTSGLKYHMEDSGWCANRPKTAWALNQLGFICACVLAYVLPEPLLVNVVFPQYQRIKIYYWEQDAAALLDNGSSTVEEMEKLLKVVPRMMDKDDATLVKLRAKYVELHKENRTKTPDQHSELLEKSQTMLKEAGVASDLIDKVLNSTDNPSQKLTKLQLLTPCPQECLKCSKGEADDDGVDLIDNRCQHWCSKDGFCGKSDKHKEGKVCDTCNSEAKKKELGEEIWQELNSKNFA